MTDFFIDNGLREPEIKVENRNISVSVLNRGNNHMGMNDENSEEFSDEEDEDSEESMDENSHF